MASTSCCPAVPTLDSVTDAGNATPNSITVGGLTVNGLTYPGVSGFNGQALVANGVGGFTWNYFLTASQPTVTGSGNKLTFKQGTRLAFDTDIANNNLITIQGPAAIAATTNYVLPVDGTAGQVLQTDGLGVLSWITIPPDSISAGNTSVVVTDTGAGEIEFNVDGNLTATVNASGLTIEDQREVRFNEDLINGSNYVGFKAPYSVPSSLAWTLPDSDGTNTQVLQTNGAGILSWRTILANSISQGNSAVTVTDTGIGKAVTTIDGNPITTTTSAAFALENLTELRLQERTTNGLNYVGFKSPTDLTGSQIWVLPPADGLSYQTLSTNGFGTLSWLSTARIVPPPTSSASPGARGEISYDIGYFYFFDGVGWRRIAGATF